MEKVSVIVIGAGVGGTAAAHLAKRGMRVTVFQKNGRPGGRCNRFSRDGHHVDTGPTLFVMPRAYEDELAALGTSVQAMLDLRRVDPSYRLVFDDGSHPRYENLYFVGASTHPGAGMPTALISARLVSKRMAEDLDPGA